MATEGIEGFYVETHNYGATAAFWQSLGYRAAFETDHASGHWEHPNGGPYLFIAERHDAVLRTYPVLRVASAETFSTDRPLEFERGFEPQHWGVFEAIALDPDGRPLSLQAPGAPTDHHGHHDLET
jgi:hypothetical protein